MLSPQAKALIVKQIERSLHPQSGKLVNHEGELKEWFIRKLDCILPIVFVNGNPDAYLVAMSFTKNRSCESLAKAYSHNGVTVSARTLRHRRRQVLESAVEVMPPLMAQNILMHALGESHFRKDGRCKHLSPNGFPCGGNQYLVEESPWGPAHEDYGKRAWRCLLCGRDEPE